MKPRLLSSELRALLLSTAFVTSGVFAQDTGTPPTSAPAQASPAGAPPGATNAPRTPAVGQSPVGGADQPIPGTSNAPRSPAAAPTAQPAPAQLPPAAGTTTNAAQEAEEAARVMESELQPKPNGLTADEIVRAALENSPNLKKATLEYDRAAANRARAKIAFAPRIDLLAGYTRLSDINPPLIDLGNGRPFRFPVFLDQYQTSARASLPITEIFLTIIPQYKGVMRLAESIDQQREAQKLQVSYDARVGFYEYARLLGSEAVARASVRVREAGVRDLESLVQAGTATQTELVRAQAELANARVLATQAAGGVEVARERLEQLAGVEIDPQRGIGEPFVEIEIGDTPDMDKVITTAMQRRPELLALSKLEKAREHLIRARKGAQYPKLQASAGVLRANPNQRFVPLDDVWKTTWDVGVNVTWSPNDAVLAHTQVTDAETDLKMVREDRRLLEQGIAIESASAVTSHRTAVEGIIAKTQQLEAARRYEADQRALLLAGAATPNDLLLAQRDLLAASLQWVDAFIAGRIAQAALTKAQGSTGLANGGSGSAP